tara:strand:+ start:3568 stop:4353 length:786 start_codon:yes stop_codon:yes gene_type:complete
MELKIKNRIAIVTGASKGMGLATVSVLLTEGVKVMMVARNESKLKLIKEKYSRQGYIIDYIAGDVGDKDLAGKVVHQTFQKWGAVDILINNAGGPPPGSFLSHESSAWDLAIQINLMSVIRFSKEVAPIMKKNKWGRIISITSTVSKEPSPSMVLSATTRAGVASFTKAISLELAEENITANVILPGGVKTDRLTSLIEASAKKENKSIEDLIKEIEEGIPAKRFAEPKEVAEVIAFLVSEKGAYINGVSLAVDGSLLKSF